ncbi:hypothetical protein [Deinococcus cellulosilyticus]|uniref:Uncharacterized protein n=1 Tax=Deinococcus cellulosilyticus (strain DSM 18568 / NBRC 106333 / KACC 11606 / 5516J-15) TaxID=1223518 RepID=A0A511N734_DEIC1|nr:hypothetical protein [Deinococcus cellulosilyticus]GEM48655.1 hypothetical protein DC3_42900 [Deinococcus cellulosilyticus NBRC 106333 = KACC 11606]
MTHITHQPNKDITVTVGETTTTLTYNSHGRYWEWEGRKWTHWPHAVGFLERHLTNPPRPKEPQGMRIALIPTPRGAAGSNTRRGA